MSDIAVRATGLTKSYTLYPSAWERMREVLGFRRRRGAEYAEHLAVDDVSLTINAGERVAFIGRNGAGKSTLLKLVTGVIEPTEGEIEITGETHALLQMGAGFHEDFTGRQNALGYLANLGVSGEKAAELVDDIVEFAELEEYIDQPLKTYSTGMQMRLIFAASTTVAPKLFVVDEVLGVGDAYFQNKSFARLQDLCENNGTTLLLVSHDIYTAAKICDRMIWIDRGRIKYDGEPKMALNLYEASIKEQEELRLAKRHEMRIAALNSANERRRYAQLEIACPANVMLTEPIWFSKISLSIDEAEYDVHLFQDADGSPSSESGSQIIEESTCWGTPAEHLGRPARPMLDHGSPFRRILAMFVLPDEIESLVNSSPVNLHLEFSGCAEDVVEMRIHSAGRTYDLGVHEIVSPGVWQNESLALSPETFEQAESGNQAVLEAIYGTGNISIDNMQILDESASPTLRVRQGGGFRLAIDYVVKDPDLEEEADLLIGLHRDGTTEVCRIFTDSLKFCAAKRPHGRILMAMDCFPLPNGTYTVSLTLARKGYFNDGSGQFYSVNPDVHICLTRFLEMQVFGGDAVASGVGLVLPADWKHVDVNSDQQIII